MMEFLRAISFFASVVATAAFLFLAVIRPFFSPSGWTKKENEGVAVRFKVFFPLYLQNPKKWKLMPDKAEYDNMMTVYFSSGLEWRKYNLWRKRAEKEQMKRQQEERKQRFMDMIFKDYQTEPNPEFTPPTTGTSVIDPAKCKYDEYSVLQHEAGTVQRDCKPILTSAIVQAEDGKIIIPPEEAGEPVSGYGDGKIYGYVQKLLPDDGNDDGKAYSINHRTGEVEGYQAIDRAVYQVYFWTSGGGKKTKTELTFPKFEFKEFDEKLAEILQEMARIKKGENRKQDDEIVCIDGAKLVQQPAEFCGNCPWASGNYPDVVICMNDHHAHLRSERCKYRKQAVLKPTKAVREGECKKCRYFQKHDKPPFGYCVRNDEITNEAYVKLCFEPIPPIAYKRQEPLGTVTTH